MEPKVSRSGFGCHQQLSIRFHEDFKIKDAESVLFDSCAGAQEIQMMIGDTQLEMRQRGQILLSASRHFDFGLWNHNQWLARCFVKANRMQVNNTHKVGGDCVEVKHVTVSDRNLSSRLRFELNNEGVVHKIDFKLPGTCCFTMFVFGRNIINITPNGEFFEAQLLKMCQFVSHRTLDSKRQRDPPFIVRNDGDPNKVVRWVEAVDGQTQTEPGSDRTQEMISAVTNAIGGAMAKWSAENQRPHHPWFNAPPLSLDMVSPKVSESKSEAATGAIKKVKSGIGREQSAAGNRIRSCSPWSYVVESKKDEELVHQRRRAKEMFGDLFSAWDKQPGDEDSD